MHDGEMDQCYSKVSVISHKHIHAIVEHRYHAYIDDTRWYAQYSIHTMVYR